VRLAVGLAAEESQLGNTELEAIERIRSGQRPDRDSDLVTWLAQVDRRPRADRLRKLQPQQPRYSHRFS